MTRTWHRQRRWSLSLRCWPVWRRGIGAGSRIVISSPRTCCWREQPRGLSRRGGGILGRPGGEQSDVDASHGDGGHTGLHSARDGPRCARDAGGGCVLVRGRSDKLVSLSNGAAIDGAGGGRRQVTQQKPNYPFGRWWAGLIIFAVL